jgi:hypothetical protein
MICQDLLTTRVPSDDGPPQFVTLSRPLYCLPSLFDVNGTNVAECRWAEMATWSQEYYKTTNNNLMKLGGPLGNI